MICPKKTKLKVKLTSGLLDLMIVIPYESITITDIVDKADVARSSFYRNYSSKDDIIYQYLLRVFYHVEDCKRTQPDRTWAEHLFQFCSHKKWFFILLSQQKLSHIIQRALLDYWNDQMQANACTYAVWFYAYGLYGVLEAWIKNEMQDTPEDVGKQFKALCL